MIIVDNWFYYSYIADNQKSNMKTPYILRRDFETRQKQLEELINATPTGEMRNHLTNANIHLLSAINELKMATIKNKQTPPQWMKTHAKDDIDNEGYCPYCNSNDIREMQSAPYYKCLNCKKTNFTPKYNADYE